MLHLLPLLDESARAPQPYAEALARLAGIRHALRLVDPYGGGPASDPEGDEEIGARWAEAPPAVQRRFDARTGGIAAAAAAGIEALLAEREAGRAPNPAAAARVAEEIRLGLEDVSRLMRR